MKYFHFAAGLLITARGDQDILSVYGAGLSSPSKTRLKDRTGDSKKHSASFNSPTKKIFRKSNRWPTSLPMASHNLFWLKNSNVPCLCLGLDPGSLNNTDSDPSLRVVPICCLTPHNETVVKANMVSTLAPDHFKSCVDERSVDFTLALMALSHYELKQDKNCKWYTYPSFIRTFLSHPPTWTSWRTSTERNARKSQEDRKTVYFRALLEELKLREAQDERCVGSDFPWDDTPQPIRPQPLPSQPVPSSSSALTGKSTASIIDPNPGDESLDSGDVKKRRISVDKKSAEEIQADKEAKQKLKLENEEKAAARLKEVEAKQHAAFILEQEREREMQNRARLSFNSMYWLPKMMLPCICLRYADSDDAEITSVVTNKFPDKLVLKPICCNTYHYKVEVRFEGSGHLEALTETRLKQVMVIV